ncbi:LytR/AlgR family response regulator transcription factor [Pseudochryseolinea flava]|uniref:DNA-binding response regulator n=1 Tax=Pseudochryseolinea flava TaxID=2059302 RepID=A0A364XW43_9BACT|nr:LytTR family DNA-binding domain-containing protein [Pseudochryseolinea flava]RAV97737.1 DNA-binding response regulator [Pseudochryseolinea flava]
MKILIIEDEALVARDLHNLIARLAPEATIIATISSVESAKTWFGGNKMPDLILSDIQLSDGISFDIFESLHVTCPIIFTTAYDDYAIRAFKLNSIDYLLKPVDPQELTAALTKYKSLSAEHLLGDQLKSLMSNWGTHAKKYKERFLTLHRNTLIPVEQDSIAYFHKEELIYIHTLDNEKFISEHHTLDEIENLLNPAVFFRVNRQFIIHIQSVGKITTTHKGLTVTLKPPTKVSIDISREKATAFKNWIS